MNTHKALDSFVVLFCQIPMYLTDDRHRLLFSGFRKEGIYNVVKYILKNKQKKTD